MDEARKLITVCHHTVVMAVFRICVTMLMGDNHRTQPCAE